MAALARLTIEGWMPFAGSHSLDLPAGPIAVVARYASNPRRSNMAGKTAFCEAITWCLFGAHRKRRDDDVINTRADACVVELSFDNMLVRRLKKRGAATVLLVAVDGETWRGTAAQTVLNDRLAQGLDDYRATCDFQQGDIESLVGMRTAKRREVIAAWLRLERWALASKQAAELTRTAQASLQAARAALATNAGLTPEEEAQASKALQATEERHHSLYQELIGVEAALAKGWDYEAVAKQIQELVRLRNEATQIKAKLQGRGVIDLAYNTAREHLDAARSAMKASETRKDGLVSISLGDFDGTCPITCKACPVPGEVQQTVAGSQDLFQALEKELGAARANMRDAVAAASKAETEMRAMETDAGRFAAIRARGQELVKLIGDRNAASVSREAARQAGHRERQAELRVEIDKVKRVEFELKAKLAANDRARELRQQCEEALARAEASVRVASLVQQALGPAGVPARIARGCVAQLEQSANELLVDSGLAVEFAWERATKDLAPTCSSCGHVFPGQRDRECPRCGTERGAKMSEELEILVDDGSGEVEDVKLKSGGARVLVASALRLSASAMLREVRGTPVGWATIDEPFGPLDTENREHLARVFSGMLGTVGLEQAFVVSHDLALLDALPNRILIERDDAGVSTLRVEAA